MTSFTPGFTSGFTPADTPADLMPELSTPELSTPELSTPELLTPETPELLTPGQTLKPTPAFQAELPDGKAPQSVFPQVVAFPPNRATLGGTAYLVETIAGHILVDSPPWTQTTRDYLLARGVRWFFLTQRSAIAQVKAIQAALNCEIIIQEQEAYLLPNLKPTTFHRELALSEELTLLWSCGVSPGSSCLHWRGEGGVLFSGRHLLPTRSGDSGDIAPLRTAKTFHWERQLRSVAALRDRFSPETLQYLCPGASIGFLRGQHCVADAYEKLRSLNLEALH